MAFGWLSGALGKDKASTPSTTLAVILSLSTPSGRGSVLVKDRKYLSLLRALPWLPPSSLLSSSSKPRVMPSSDTLSFSLSFGTPGTSAFTTNLSSSSSKSIFGHCCLSPCFLARTASSLIRKKKVQKGVGRQGRQGQKRYRIEAPSFEV